MRCSHEINSREINSREIDSSEINSLPINSREINFSPDQLLRNQLMFFGEEYHCGKLLKFTDKLLKSQDRKLWQCSHLLYKELQGVASLVLFDKTKCLDLTPDCLHKIELTARMCGIGEVEGGGLNNC